MRPMTQHSVSWAKIEGTFDPWWQTYSINEKVGAVQVASILLKFGTCFILSRNVYKEDSRGFSVSPESTAFLHKQ